MRAKICFLISVTFLGLLSCNDQPRIGKGIVYPDMISPIYYVDTFQIKSPRIALVDSVPYIFSWEKMMPFEDKEDFLNQKGVIQFLTPELHMNREITYLEIYEFQNSKKTFVGLAEENEFYFDELFLPDDSLKNIPVKKFVFEPEKFLLTLISTKDSLIKPKGLEYNDPANDVVLDVIFSKDYILALVPIYSKQDLRTINELWYRRLHGREIDWNDYPDKN